MLRNKPFVQKGYWEKSLHGFAIRELKACREKTPWPSMSDKDKASRLSFMWVAYLDRLDYSQFDTSPVMRSYEQLNQLIGRKVWEMQTAYPTHAVLVNRLHQLNVLQLDCLQENGIRYYDEAAGLSKNMFHRLSMIKHAMLQSAVDLEDVDASVAALFTELNKMADDLDYLALRHFYSTFSTGRTECAAALCMGGSFIRSVAGSLLLHWEDTCDPIREAARHAAFDREYDLELLCSFGRDFDFPTFDDETNTLLPEVVDLLFPDA